MSKIDIVITMPVFNESDGILEFLTEVEKVFGNYEFAICIVDDKSTDDTLSLIQNYALKKPNIHVIPNHVNIGHGPSTYLALKNALDLNPKFILAVDGDGQFIASEMLNYFESANNSSFDYCEGIRIQRNDQWFRKLITLGTRFLVLVKSGKIAKDANTPCRIYSAARLKAILFQIPPSSLIPNLLISIYVRKKNLTIYQYKLRNISRRGISAQGSTWGKKMKIMPNKKLLKFCLNATKEIFKS